MKLGKLSLIANCLVWGTLLCSGVAKTQMPDRIMAFDCRITVERDRTVHVAERFEIVNGDGLFDGGFHRRLRIKPVSAQRVKAGSFESVTAKVDGDDAKFRTREDGSFFDVEIATPNGSLTRGSHVIELNYLAKHQFAIYKDFEDFNQDISGEWPVVIEKAAVQLSFPGTLPKETGISADTGTESNFQFDCARTILPNGVKFETTHPVAAGNRLFISARFPHSGYFVSNFQEDGFRAVSENHPLLIPGVVSLCGLIVLTTVGLIIWRRAPTRVAAVATASAEAESSVTFWREVIKVYSFPIVMFALAIIPGLNFTYSGHGGISWFFLPLCFPCVIVTLLIKIAKGSEQSSRWYKDFFKITIPFYIAISLPLSWAAATSIRMTFGLPISTWSFFAVMVSPFPWWYFM